MSETAKWLKSREDWLRVIAIPGVHGGFDIALVIDGSYSLEAGPQRLVRAHAERLIEVLKADGLPLGRPTPVGVRPREDSAAGHAEQRTAARQAVQQACDDRDLDALYKAMGAALGPQRDAFTDLEDAYHEEGDSE